MAAASLAEKMKKSVECRLCFAVKEPIYGCSKCPFIFCGGCRDDWIQRGDVGTAAYRSRCPGCREPQPRDGVRSKLAEDIVATLGLAEEDGGASAEQQRPAAAARSPKRRRTTGGAAARTERAARSGEDAASQAAAAPAEEHGFTNGKRSLPRKRLPVNSSALPAIGTRVEVEFEDGVYSGVVAVAEERSRAEGAQSRDVLFDSDGEHVVIRRGQHRWRVLGQSAPAVPVAAAVPAASAVSAASAVPAVADASQLWAPSLDAGTRVFRARQFCNAVARPGDPTGLAPSMWAVNHGFIASCARVVPPDIETVAAAAEYFRRPRNEICDYLSASGFHSGKDLARYVSGYVLFAHMRAGDVVALQANEGPHRQVFYFGQVESDDVLLVPKQELMDGYRFPDCLDWGFTPWRCNRMMLRKVKWLRRAIARELPGQKTSSSGQVSCGWLLEAYSPFWLSEVTVTDKKADDPVNAVEMLCSAEFLGNSFPLRFPVSKSEAQEQAAWEGEVRGGGTAGAQE